MKNLKISIKLFRPHIVILLLLVTGIIVNLVSLLNIGKQIAALYDGAYIVKNAANTMDAAFEGIQKSIFQSITNDSQDITNEETVNIKNNSGIIQEQVALIKQNPLGDKVILSRLEKYLSELGSMQEHVLYLVAQNKNSEAAEYMENNNIPVIKEAQKELAQLIQSAEAKEIELVASLQQTQRNTIILLISLGVIGVLLGIRGGIYIWRLQKDGKQNLFNPVQMT